MKGLSTLERKLIDGDQFEGPLDYTDREVAVLNDLYERGIIRIWRCDRCNGVHFDVTPVGALVLAATRESS